MQATEEEEEEEGEFDGYNEVKCQCFMLLPLPMSYWLKVLVDSTADF